MGTVLNDRDSFASKLRRIAEEKNNSKHDRIVNKIVKTVLSTAEKIAAEGSFSCTFYHDDLDNIEVSNLVIDKLKIEGFRAKVYEDVAYSKHAGKNMFYVEVFW